MNVSDESLVFNGVNAATGEYLLPPLSAAELGKVARGEKLDPKHLDELKWRYRTLSQVHLGVKAGVDPTKLGGKDGSGWGVVFPHNAPPAVIDALRPLLDHRKAQADELYREYTGKDGYRPNESKGEFLARHGAGPGPADPDKVPYYLLLVGSPEEIPFRVQYQLDVQYAVGRIAFDTPDEYANYAASVVAAETQPLAGRRRIAFFGPSNPLDRATALSSRELVTPLARDIAGKLPPGTPAWEVRSHVGSAATKPVLASLLGGDDTPAVLFTASHGVGFPNGDPKQLRHQGALLCQEWMGPTSGPVGEEKYFSRDDLGATANPFGMIAFFFACYGGGTPRLDDFAHAAFKETRPALAPHAFLAGLPRRLLAHPKGGALAVVAHVDRAWGYSFRWDKAGPQLAVFESALQQLMEGYPVGAAMEFFNERYAELAANLTDELEELKYGKRPDDYALAGLWTANNDARSYVVLGDPAVRVAVSKADAPPPATRPSLTLKDPPPPPPVVANAPPPAFDTQGDGPPGVLSVIGDTERRARERAENLPPPSFGPTPQPVLRANPPGRVRKRLTRLGLPEAEIDRLMEVGSAFAVLPPLGTSPTAAAVGLERIIGRNDLIGVEFLAAAVEAARAVGRVVLRRRGVVAGYGSGAMVSPRLFLTNNHVLASRPVAETGSVEFGYEYDRGGALRTPRVVRFAPEHFFLTDPRLDFTLVAVAEPPGVGWLTLNDDDGAVLAEEYVNVVQHPDGRPKQVALRDNLVTDILDDFLHYRADTEPGSSGAPVLNDQWEFVGLHRAGVPKRNEQGQILARGGGVWSPELGEAAIHWIANEGVRVGRILAHLKAATMPTGGEAFRDELLSAVLGRPSAGPPARPPVEVVPASAPAPVAPAGTSAVAPNAVTVTVPLQITISLPSAGASAVGAAAPPVQVTEGLFGSSGYVPSPLRGRFAAAPLARPTPGWDTHLSLALASHLAYADAGGVADTARGLWHLDTCDVIAVNATFCYIASTPEVVLVAFRGTVNLTNWLTNLDVFSRPRPYGTVHRGFSLAFADVQSLLERRLDDFGDRPLVLTGHSLGGALAAVAAAEWQGRRAIRGVHTFGQPAVGKRNFRDFMNAHYRDSFFRFVNDDDIVPQVPPGYQHAGRRLRFDAGGVVTREGVSLTEAAAVADDGPTTMHEAEFAALQAELRAGSVPQPAVREAAPVALEGLFPSVSDHDINRYVEKASRQS